MLIVYSGYPKVTTTPGIVGQDNVQNGCLCR